MVACALSGAHLHIHQLVQLVVNDPCCLEDLHNLTNTFCSLVLVYEGTVRIDDTLIDTVVYSHGPRHYRQERQGNAQNQQCHYRQSLIHLELELKR